MTTMATMMTMMLLLIIMISKTRDSNRNFSGNRQNTGDGDGISDSRGNVRGSVNAMSTCHDNDGSSGDGKDAGGERWWQL